MAHAQPEERCSAQLNLQDVLELNSPHVPVVRSPLEQPASAA